MNEELENKKRLAKNIELPADWTSPQITLAEDGQSVMLTAYNHGDSNEYTKQENEMVAEKMKQHMIEYLEKALGYKIEKLGDRDLNHGDFEDPNWETPADNTSIATIDTMQIEHLNT